MTTYECPAEGCDFEADSIGSMRSHINAKSGPEHQDKEGLRAALAEQTTSESGESEGQQGDEEQAKAGAEAAPEGPEAGALDDEEPEQANEQGEAGEKRASEQGESAPSDGSPEDNDNETMPTEEEYADFVGDGPKESDSEESDQSPPENTGMGLPVNTWTIAGAVGAVIALYLLWRLHQRRSSTTSATVDGDDQESDDNEVGLIE